MMDKRDLSSLFRERLKMLLQRSDLNQSAFAAAVGIDRSALSQLLSGASTRLPRAETLLNIAAEHKVSLDWLLGLSQDEGLTGEIRASLEIEEGARRLRPHAAGALARRGGGHQDPLRAGRHSRSAAHRRADRLRGRHHQPQPRSAGRRDAVPHRLQPPAGDRHGGLHAAPHAGDLCARARRLERLSRSASAASSSPTWRRCSTTSTRPSACSSMTAACAIRCPTRSSARIRAAIYVGDMYLVLNATAADPHADPPFRQSDPRGRRQRA